MFYLFFDPNIECIKFLHLFETRLDLPTSKMSKRHLLWVYNEIIYFSRAPPEDATAFIFLNINVLKSRRPVVAINHYHQTVFCLDDVGFHRMLSIRSSFISLQ